MSRNSKIERTCKPSNKIGSIAALILVLVLPLFSCTPDSAERALPVARGYSDTYSQGQYSLTQRINKKEITVADQVRIVLETTTPENTEVKFPQYKKSLGDFTLIDSQADPPRLTGAGDAMRIIHTVTYLVEPYLPGSYNIPEMAVTYTDKLDNTINDTVVTEEKQISVKSLLPNEGAEVELKDIRGPFTLPPDSGRLVILAILFLLLIAGSAAAFFYWRKIFRSKVEQKIRLEPHDIAFAELEKLLAQGLLAEGEVKLFHLRISNIMRRYIENRFGVRAPEQTTEEFLTAVSNIRLHERSILGSNRTLLADFLRHCDLVKFARHEPTTAECEKTVSLCREFIEKTKESRIQRAEGSRGRGVKDKNIAVSG